MFFGTKVAKASYYGLIPKCTKASSVACLTALFWMLFILTDHANTTYAIVNGLTAS